MEGVRFWSVVQTPMETAALAGAQSTLNFKSGTGVAQTVVISRRRARGTIRSMTFVCSALRPDWLCGSLSEATKA